MFVFTYGLRWHILYRQHQEICVYINIYAVFHYTMKLQRNLGLSSMPPSSARYYLVFIVVVNSRVEPFLPFHYTFTSETELPKLVQKVQYAFGLWHDLQNSNTLEIQILLSLRNTSCVSMQRCNCQYFHIYKHIFRNLSLNFMSFYCLQELCFLFSDLEYMPSFVYFFWLFNSQSKRFEEVNFSFI